MCQEKICKRTFQRTHVIKKKREGQDDVVEVTDKKEVEWEVRKMYWNLYGEQETRVNTEKYLRVSRN